MRIIFRLVILFCIISSCIQAESLDKLITSCELNNSTACVQSALNLKSQNKYLDSKKYYKKACDLDNSSGCYNLASYYFYGDFASPELTQDLELARELFLKSCNLKNSQACYNLGAFYRYGKGVSPDLKQALLYFQKGCELNHSKSCGIYKQISQ